VGWGDDANLLCVGQIMPGEIEVVSMQPRVANGELVSHNKSAKVKVPPRRDVANAWW
jgi:hypothetical protein